MVGIKYKLTLLKVLLFITIIKIYVAISQFTEKWPSKLFSTFIKNAKMSSIFKKIIISVKWSYQYVKLSELLKYAYSFMWF